MHPSSAIHNASATFASTPMSDGHRDASSGSLGKTAYCSTLKNCRKLYRTHQIYAGLFSVLAVVAVTFHYFRICYGVRSGGGVPRRLAGGQPAADEDPVLSAILDMCLDMEEEVGGCPQARPVPQEELSGPHSSWQSLPSLQQEQPTRSAVPSSSAWGSLQGPPGEVSLQQIPPPVLQKNYHGGWPVADEIARALPLGGPSIYWQHSSMLPTQVGVPLTRLSTKSTPTVYPLPGNAPLPLQDLGVGSSSGVAGTLRISTTPTVAGTQNYVSPVDLLASGQPLNVQKSAVPPTSDLLQEVLRPKGQSAEGELQSPPGPRPSRPLKRQNELPVQLLFGGSGSGAYLRTKHESLPQVRSSTGVQPAQHSLPPYPVQAVQNSGKQPQAETPIARAASGAGVMLTPHPFYRLPKVTKDVILRVVQISSDTVFSKGKKGRLPTWLLRMVHDWLARDSLSVVEANHLARCAEQIAQHLHHSHREPLTCVTPAEAVVILGRRYVMLEMLLCAVKALGTTPEVPSWWKTLGDSIPSQAILSPCDFPSRRCKQYIVLAKRLSSAISLLKEGTRPGERETIDLKRELFCRTNSHPEFKHNRWEAWRIDDRKGGQGLMS